MSLFKDMVDRAEAQTLGAGSDGILFAARLLGFDDWPHVVRLARDEQHKVAIELLCRRVERGL